MSSQVSKNRIKHRASQWLNELICSQENAPGSHKSPREIQQETGIVRSLVRRIAKLDLNLKWKRSKEHLDRNWALTASWNDAYYPASSEENNGSFTNPNY